MYEHFSRELANGPDSLLPAPHEDGDGVVFPVDCVITSPDVYR